MTTSNPALGTFNNVGALGGTYGATTTMTLDGTIHKTGILAALLALSFIFSWVGLSHAEVPPMLPITGAAIGGLILALIICFSPTTAPYLSPVYALVEGLFMAGLSFILEQKFPMIALQAAGLTIFTVFGMLIAYRTGLIKVNNTFRAVVVGATISIFIYLMAGFIASFFGVVIPGLGINGSWLSIGVSAVIVIVAALNLALDFDMISRGEGQAPKYMEWYGAFALMVTVIWLYVSLLRFLANVRSR